MDERPENFRNIQLKLLCEDAVADQRKIVFYSIFSNVHRFHSKAPVIAVYHNATCAIQVLFSVSGEAWKYPECVIARNSIKYHKLFKTKNWTDGNIEMDDVHLDWSARSAALVGLNRTHAICNFERSGIYTIIIRPDHGALVSEILQ